MAAIALTIASAMAIVVLKNWLPPLVPLFYGKPSGSGQLVTTYELLIAPGVSLLVIIINTFLSLYIPDLFLKKTLIIGAFLLSLLTAITVFKIIFLVGFF